MKKFRNLFSEQHREKARFHPTVPYNVPETKPAVGTLTKKKKCTCEETEQLDEMPGANMDTRAVHSHLKKQGWQLTRTSGSHDVFTHPKSKEHIPVPRHRKLKAPLVLGILRKSKVTEETEMKKDIREARLAMPLKGHDYHYKSDAELKYIQKDAHEAAQAMKGHNPKAEGKYLDQHNDASTVLHYRSKGGQQLRKEEYEMNEETHPLSAHASKLEKYAHERGGIDKEDMLTAAEHMKSNNHEALKNKIRKMDTDPRDKVLDHIHPHHWDKLGFKPTDSMQMAVHRHNKMHGIKEETEQLDELKKSTLASYVGKAHTDAVRRSERIGASWAKDPAEMNPRIGMARKKNDTREAGIKTALKKLNKEEVELDEENKPTNPELWARAKAMAKSKFDVYPCVPLDSLAISKSGPISHDELEVGNEILTYNMKEDKLEWKPVLHKHYYENAPLLEIGKPTGFSLRCTPNHKWVISRANEKELVETKDLNTHMKLLMCSTLKNESSLLIENWTKKDSWIEKVLPMNEREREIFLASSVVYDGWDKGLSTKIKERHTFGFVQKEYDHLWASLLAAYLNGYYVNSREKTEDMTSASYIRNKRFHNTQNLYKKDAGFEDVWCPTTENETWVMIQNGLITITGNSAYANGWAAKWYKSKGGGWKSVNEEIDEREYDYEGEMVKSDLRSIIANANRLINMLSDEENLPEWCQNKITLAEDYVSTVANYMTAEMNEEAMPYVAVHAKKGKHETHGKTSYEAAQNAAKHWKMKNTAGIDVYRADKIHSTQHVGESVEIHKPGTKVRVPHKGKMVSGKIVRYDSGKGGYSPAYVVDIGEYESKLVPAHHNIQKEEVEPPFTPTKPKKDVVVGKRGEGMAKVRQLARMAVQKQIKKPVKEEKQMSKKAQIVKDASKKMSDEDKFQKDPELGNTLTKGV